MTSNTTQLVNIYDHGRSNSRPIDRSSRLGNPFKLEKDGGDYTRKGSVEAYAEWFHDRLEYGEPDDGLSADEFQDEVESLRGKDIGCWCVPDLCHGHVILYYLDTGDVPENIVELSEWGAPDRTTAGTPSNTDAGDNS